MKKLFILFLVLVSLFCTAYAEETSQFVLRDNLHWNMTKDDVIASMGEPLQDKTFNDIYCLIYDDVAAGDIPKFQMVFFFSNNSLISMMYYSSSSSDAAFEYLKGTLSSKYGEGQASPLSENISLWFRLTSEYSENIKNSWKWEYGNDTEIILFTFENDMGILYHCKDFPTFNTNGF